jgi:hypothetical protein
MAYQTGTASGPVDLWDKVVAFLTTNSTLVAAGEDWDVVWTAPSGLAKDGIVLRGPGASGLDSIFVGLSREDSDISDRNKFWLRGMTGVVTSAPTIDDHVNSSNRVGMFVDTNPMKYWIVANGRRFVIVVNMSTVYQSMYAGFFLPFANPLSYNYPLFVGGSFPDWTLNGLSNAALSWRSTVTVHSSFPFPAYNTESGSVFKSRSCSQYLDPNGAWINLDTNYSNATEASHIAPMEFAPLTESGIASWAIVDYGGLGAEYLGYNNFLPRIEENVGGGYSLSPATLIQTRPSLQTYGSLDGVFIPAWQNQAVENIIQVGGVDHLVVQNAFRTNRYWGLRLN